MKVLFAILLTACISLGASAQSYLLKLNLKEGQRFTITSAIDMDMNVTAMGQEMKVKNKMNFYYAEQVKSVSADGSFRMELTFNRIGIEFSGSGADLSYDTDISEGKTVQGNSSLGQAIQPLIGKKFYAIVSPSGKVESIEGLKELVDTISAGMDPTRSQILKSMASDEKMKASLQSSYGYLPDHKISIGDSWSQNIKMDITIPISTDLVYTLKEVKGDIATVGIVANSHTKDDNYQMAGIAMKMDITTQMSGEGTLNMTTGIFSKTKMNVDMKGSVEAMGSAMPLTSTGISESTIVSVK